ncbi:MAG: substrate-binding domain-containing protein [Bifidobacteriaceae bacterium]|jgi:ribose transport system substrate-binding protein|nr:substrate-binding domain-containing protein [Bifidobacteriaceae bacterium]
MKKLIATALIGAVAATALVACSDNKAGGGGSTQADGGAGNASGTTIALVAKANASDYWTAVKTGAMAAGKDLGVTVTFNGPDTESEGDKQLNMLQTQINNKPAAIGFAPQDGAQDGAPAVLDQAKAANIPVAAFDTPINQSEVPIATIASDNQGIGRMAAEHLIEATGKPGKVAVIAHGEVGTAADRRDGFKAAVEAAGYQVVDVQNGESDPAKSRDKAQAILQAHPDLVGFFGTDDDSVIAVADEVKAKNLGSQVKVVGVDSSPDEVALVKTGEIDGAVTQNPFDIGYKTVEILVKAVGGEVPADKNVAPAAVWYTASNMDSPEVVKVLNS